MNRYFAHEVTFGCDQELQKDQKSRDIHHTKANNSGSHFSSGTGTRHIR